MGRLFEFLDDEELLERALVVLTADHGEAMGEDDFYFAHGHSLGLDQVHVPLVMAGPGIAEGTVVDLPVSHVAVYSTILDFVDATAARATGPASLLPLAYGTSAPSRTPIPFYLEGPRHVGVVHGASYLYRERSDDLGGPNVLVRPATETHPRPKHGVRFIERVVGEGHSGSAAVSSRARLEDLLDAFEKRSAEARAELAAHREERPWSARSLERLRSIGYLR